MRPPHLSLAILIALSFLALSCDAYRGDDSLRISVGVPYITNAKKISIDLYYSSNESVTDTVELACYKFNSKSDSVLVYRMSGQHIKLQMGIHSKALVFDLKAGNAWYNQTYYNILKKTGSVPPGVYKTSLVLTGSATNSSATEGKLSTGNTPYQRTFTLSTDSALSASSSIRKEMDANLVPTNRAGILDLLKAGTVSTISNGFTGSKAIKNGSRRLERLFKARGLNHRMEQRGYLSYVNLYYEDWFAGRYEMDANSSAAAQISRQKSTLAGNAAALTNNELGSYQSLFSQVRELTKNAKEDKELKGELALTAAWSTGQPEYSAQDNNYYEARGRVETEVFDIPIGIEGYYTTQDAHRIVKGSYVRLHYDADKAKAKLLKLINGYKNQYAQTLSKSKSLDQVYGSYISSLESQKGKILSEIGRDAGIYGIDVKTLDTAALRSRILSSLQTRLENSGSAIDSQRGKVDAAGNTQKAIERSKVVQDSATRVYERAMKRYEQVRTLEEKANKFRNLLDQYQNTIYFDSALAYDKIKNLESGEGSTYKQLAKSASGLLPEGKGKQLISGLTSLDAGIFPKYVSKYTMGGQQLTGLDLGYDIGFAQVGVTAGRTSYAGRDGSLDKYTSYGARILFTPLKSQKVGLVYYGYTPSRSAINNDGFYKNIDISLPSFREPVHIVSATYEGTIAKTVTIDGEAATSFRKGSGQNLQNGMDAGRLAWHLNAEGQVPQTGITITGSYEHGGKEFQNSTLPMMIAGADLYKIAGKGEFFRGLLQLGIEFNHMQQSSFYSTGGNNRWGFSIATQSKRYPSLSLSYKPFATFRNNTDTLLVPQRPLLGAVWSGKATYQIKKLGGISWRFSTVINVSTSNMDTVGYSSKLIQFSSIYSTKELMAMLAIGQNSMSSGGVADTAYPAHVKTTFATAGLGRSFSKSVTLTIGADIGFARFGLSKFGLNTGLSYRFKGKPLTVRTNTGYTAYKLEGFSGATRADGNMSTIDGNTTDPMAWRNIVHGSIDLIWQFRVKLKE